MDWWKIDSEQVDINSDTKEFNIRVLKKPFYISKDRIISKMKINFKANGLKATMKLL